MGLFSDLDEEATVETREMYTKIIALVVVFIIGIVIGYLMQ
jgi:hypothetical protein